MSLCGGRGGHRNSLHVNRGQKLRGHLRGRMRVHVERLQLRRRLHTGPGLERLQQGVDLAEGLDLSAVGQRFFVVLQQGLRRLRRQGAQDGVRRGRRATRVGHGLGVSEGKRRL